MSNTTLRNWKILDYGSVNRDIHNRIEYTCMGCMIASLLPVTGTAIAQMDAGLIFDAGNYAVPTKIRCPWCRKELASYVR